MHDGERSPLLYPCQPWSDESVLNSYQLRLRQNNGIGSLRDLDSLAGRRRVTTPVRLLTEPDVSRLLGRLAGLQFDLSDDMPRVLESAATGRSNCRVLRWRGGELSLQFWMHGRAQVCPECLRGKGYLDYTLDYWHVPVCGDHHCLLVDSCRACQRLLSADRPSLFHCGSCGHDLSTDELRPVSRSVADFANELASLQRFELVAAEGSTSLEPSQLAALVAHFASGEYVESLADELPVASQHLSAQERLRGLTLLAGCVSGRTIDAALLRDTIVRRTRYLEAFKETAFFDWWLIQGLDRTDLGIRASNAVAHGRADDVSHLAAHQSVARELRVASAAEARALFDLTSYEFDELVKWTKLSIETDAIGYDAEELVGALAFYRGCIDEHELDACFGLEGLTGQLLSHGKLQEFAPRAAPPRKVTPESLNRFLASLEREVPRTDETEAAVSVSACVAGDEEPGRMAANLLMGVGAVTSWFAGWAAPFRLADIRCDLETVCAGLGGRPDGDTARLSKGGG